MNHEKNVYLTGFTLVEVIIVFGISVLLTVITASVFSNYSKSQRLETEAFNIKNTIERARALTLSGKDSSQYGVHLESDKIVFFKGETYSVGNSSNEIYALPSSVKLSNILLNGGGNDVVFKKLTGETFNYGSTTITDLKAGITTKIINVSRTGNVYY